MGFKTETFNTGKNEFPITMSVCAVWEYEEQIYPLT